MAVLVAQTHGESMEGGYGGLPFLMKLIIGLDGPHSISRAVVCSDQFYQC
jgi:hypothetical protein